MEHSSSTSGPIRLRRSRIHSRRPYERVGTTSASEASTTNSNNTWLYVNSILGHLKSWLRKLTAISTTTTLTETTSSQQTSPRTVGQNLEQSTRTDDTVNSGITNSSNNNIDNDNKPDPSA